MPTPAPTPPPAVSPSTSLPLTAALATRPGTKGASADAACVFTTADGAVAVAVIDGMGHAPATVRLAPVLAEVAARASAARGPLAGLLTASLLLEVPGLDDDVPDAVAVAALRTPGGRTVVAWVGDCRAYGWDGVLTELDSAFVQVKEVSATFRPWTMQRCPNGI